MTKATKILLIFVLLASLQTLSNAFVASENGEVRLHRDGTSDYFVKVDLGNKPAATNNVYRARVVLNDNQTLLYSECIDCEKNKCYFTDKKDEKGNRIGTADLTVDYSSWSLKADASFNERNCKNYIVGDLGFGMNGSAINSFIGKKIFSIYINHNAYGSKLLFKSDKSFAASDDKIVLQTNANWQALYEAANTSIKVGDQTFYFAKGSVEFDLNRNYVAAFSSERCQMILDIFRDYGIFCDGSTCTGKIEDFPKISLNVGGNSIVIPPEAYTKPQEEAEKKAKVQTIYFSSNNKDDDSIVLGSLFMNYYYTVFESAQNKNTVTLYVKNPNPSSSGSGLGWIIAIIIIGLIAAAVIFVYKKKQSQSLPISAPLNATS